MPETQKISSLKWIKKNCIFPPGSSLIGQPCGDHLLPFQIRILNQALSGKSLFLYGARKISKSLLFSWILFHRLSQDKQAFVCPLLASSEEQTKIIFNFIRFQVGTKKQNLFKVRQGYIENNATGSLIFRAPSRAGALFGYQPSAVVADELSNWKDEECLEAVESGFGLSANAPLRLYASNPPKEPVHFVLDKLKECEGDSDFVVHRFEAGKKDNWMSRETWKKANPFLKSHYSKNGKKFPVLADFYTKRFNSAKQSKTAEVNFRRYQIGQTIFANFNKWLDITKIKLATEDIYKRNDILWGLGADISTSRDFTSFCLVGVATDESVYFKPFLFLPNIDHRRVTHKFKFEKWHKEGNIRIQGTNVTNREAIVQEIKTYIEKHKIKIGRLIIDQYRAESWYEDFSDFKLEKVTCSPRVLTMPIRELERACHGNKLHIIGLNPCMEWQINNCVVSDQSKHWVSLHRTDTKEANIDGPIALCLGASWPFTKGFKKSKSFFVNY